MPKACVILGAGASLDVRNEGSPIMNGTLTPPLAKELFDFQKREAFWNFIAEHHGARVVAQNLAVEMKSPDFNLEESLRHYAFHDDVQYQQHYKDVPAYLRDLLQAVSYRYTNNPSGHIRLVTELLAEHAHELLFLVLNYDDFLEQALHSCYPSTYGFSNMSDYTAPDRQAKVVKLHGSIDWFTAMPGQEQWRLLVDKHDISVKPAEDAILVVKNVTSLTSTLENGNRLYPLLTAPLAGKGMTDMVCPTSHLDAATEFLHDCNKFLVIGTSGLDTDLLELLDMTINPEVDHTLHVVGLKGSGKETHSRLSSHVRAFSTFTPPFQKIFEKGYQEYLYASGLSSFATDDPHLA